MKLILSKTCIILITEFQYPKSGDFVKVRHVQVLLALLKKGGQEVRSHIARRLWLTKEAHQFYTSSSLVPSMRSLSSPALNAIAIKSNTPSKQDFGMMDSILPMVQKDLSLQYQAQ